MPDRDPALAALMTAFVGGLEARVAEYEGAQVTLQRVQAALAQQGEPS